MKNTTHFMLVDDEPVFQIGLREVLRGLKGHHEFKESKQLPIPLAQEVTSQIDVLLFSVGKSWPIYAASLSQLRTNNPDLRIILISSFPSRTQLKAAAKIGVHGYISKNASTMAFLDLITRVLTMSVIISSDANFTEMEQAGLVHLRPDESTMDLTQDEISILHAIAMGARTADIAKKHHWSYSKAKKGVHQTLQKMQASSRSLAVIKALRQRII